MMGFISILITALRLNTFNIVISKIFHVSQKGNLLIHRTLIVLILILNTTISIAQDKEGVKVVARAQENKILLRWAPTKAIIWQYANTYGYTLERYTILRDSAIVQPAKKFIIGAFSPNPLADWEHKIETNDYAAVAAQALYGETFELTQNYSSDIMQVINKTKELEQRFSFALFAADQSFEVAQMQGLAFADTLAKANEKYLYKVYANIPPSIEELDSGVVYIGMADFAPLPQPIDLTAVFGDGMVMLRWNREFFERIYNSFIIERSDDNGKTFQKITQEPVVNTFSSENPNSKYNYKMDSIANGIKYIYQVKGISPFGELGPASKTAEGVGSQKMESHAQITNHSIAPNNRVNLSWHFDEASETLINGFVVQRAVTSKGPFNGIGAVNEVNVRRFEDQNPMPSAYYRVGIIRNEVESNFSFPYLVQLEDSIPPAIPSGILAMIDTTGVVTLTWNKNTEPDLLGYRVYRSNFKSAEFAQITSSPIAGVSLTDSINLKTLTSKIYYSLASVDIRNNASAFSEVIEVIKPDIIPPVPPVFDKVSAGKNGIYIQWLNSSSEDVASHTIYRRIKEEDNWLLIAKISSLDTTNYTDNSVEHLQPYQYTLVAMDQGGLESTPAVPVVATKTYAELVKFNKFNFWVNREKNQIELKWEITSQELIDGVLVYRAKGDAALSFVRKVEAIEAGFIDAELTLNTTYTYRIKAVFENGGFGDWSDEVYVNF